MAYNQMLQSTIDGVKAITHRFMCDGHGGEHYCIYHKCC